MSPDRREDGGRTRSSMVAVAVVSAAITAVFVLAAVADAKDKRALGPGFVEGYEGATGVDLVLASGDGQAYAAFARDPSLGRPGVFPSHEEAAYRASRPLWSYAAWALSLGRSDWVPWVMMLLTVLSGGLAGAASGALLEHRHRSAWFGVTVAVLPGSVASASWLLPEVLAFGLAAAGLAVWERGRRLTIAVFCLTLAGLTREVLLLVPFVLFIRMIRATGIRPALPLLTPFVVWLTWAAVIRARIGHWPFEWHADTRAELPFSGLTSGIGRWDELGMNVPPNIAALAFLVAIAAALVVLRHDDIIRWIALAFLVIPPFFWAEMWHRWQDFTRVLLPLTAFGVVSLAALIPRRQRWVDESP